MTMPKDYPVVWYTTGMTLNLGNYESQRVECGASFPVNEGEDPADAFARCVEFVDAHLEEQLAAARGEEPVKKKTRRTKKTTAKRRKKRTR